VHISPHPRFRVDGRDLESATAHARGTLLTWVDEADRYGPEHVWDLVLARHYSGATLVGKGGEFSDHSGVTVWRPMLLTEAYTSRVARAAMLVARRDLGDLGGWARLPARVRDAGGLPSRALALGSVRGSAAPVPGHIRARWSGPPPYPEFGR
jgi:hypothetical protein